MTKLACQTITWGPERLFRNYADVLKEVSEAGFSGVETNLAVLKKHASELKDLFYEYELELVAAHTGVVDLQNTSLRDFVEELILLKDNGCHYLLVSAPSDSTVVDLEEYGNFLSRITALTRDMGVEVCFHNHSWELANNFAGLNALLKATQGKVELAVDFGWVVQAGVDLDDFVRKFGAYIRYVHLKDFGEGEWRELGRGTLPVEKVLEVIRPLNLTWWVVEQDTTNKTPIESAILNRNFLSSNVI